MAVDSFRTHRLSAARLRPADLAELCRLHRDTVVMATLGGVRSDEETRRFLATNLDHGSRYGFGLGVFRVRPGPGLVGRAGLRRLVIGGQDMVELSYALRAEAWGRGLATEMARAVLGIGFERLGLDSIVAMTLPYNAASRRVMEKYGLRYEREVTHAGLPHVLYRLDRPQLS